MQPGYPAGSFLLVRWGCRAVAPGQVVVARRPDRPELLIVKRVVRVLESGAVWVAGDNPAASDDSRLFGALPPSAIVGRVLFRYHPLRVSSGGWPAKDA